jgi:hypothetical protein
MIKTTRWRPDTCGCLIEYTWDTDAPAGAKIYTPTFCEPCRAHLQLATLDGRYAAVVAENTKKNTTIARLVDSGVIESADQASWEFSEKRRLSVAVQGVKVADALVELAGLGVGVTAKD